MAFPVSAKKSAAVILLLLFACISAEASLFQKPPFFVESGKEYSGDLFLVNQKLLVEGTVRGNVGSILGTIEIKGKVEGNISVLRGSVTILPGAEVVGNVICLGGRLDVQDGALLQGKERIFFSPDAKKGLQLSGKARASWYFAICALLFLLVIVTFYIFPNQINDASFELSQELVPAIIKGAVTLGAFAVALMISFLLMALAIGIPMFVLLGCAAVVIMTFGGVVVFYRLAQILENRSGRRLSLVISTLIVILATTLLAQIPWLGDLIKLSILVLGTGIVIDTRFGTNKSWFTKQTKFWEAD